ncbi:MAG: hypothetical protein KatS3mg029_1021 [Saprospiraceae bacterium]|nr:MAG: hypothetical protein KatS3mg029_1021 [Saprospiraceae bacterium]
MQPICASVAFVALALQTPEHGMSEPLSDRELLELLQRRPEEAMQLLFERHYASVVRVVLRIVGNEATAEDLAQDLMYDIWKNRQQLHINSSFDAYLRRAATNRSLNYLRDNKHRWDSDEALHVLPNKMPLGDQLLQGEELQQAIDHAIDSLPERCRLIFVLSRFEDMSNKEIAEQLGISVKTVENQMTKALRMLRTLLEPLLQNAP